MGVETIRAQAPPPPSPPTSTLFRQRACIIIHLLYKCVRARPLVCVFHLLQVTQHLLVALHGALGNYKTESVLTIAKLFHTLQ